MNLNRISYIFEYFLHGIVIQAHDILKPVSNAGNMYVSLYINRKILDE